MGVEIESKRVEQMDMQKHEIQEHCGMIYKDVLSCSLLSCSVCCNLKCCSIYYLLKMLRNQGVVLHSMCQRLSHICLECKCKNVHEGL